MSGTKKPERKQLRKIVEKKWFMFLNVNGEEQADCQDDASTYAAMRMHNNVRRTRKH